MKRIVLTAIALALTATSAFAAKVEVIPVPQMKRAKIVYLQRGYNYDQSMCFTDNLSTIQGEPARFQKDWAVYINEDDGWVEFKNKETKFRVRCDLTSVKYFSPEEGWSEVTYEDYSS